MLLDIERAGIEVEFEASKTNHSTGQSHSKTTTHRIGDQLNNQGGDGDGRRTKGEESIESRCYSHKDHAERPRPERVRWNIRVGLM